MIVKPDIWGDTMRVRLMNTWSPNPITIGHVTIGQRGTDDNTMTAHNTITQFILNSGGVYDSLADFYDATRDPNNSNFLTTVLQPQFATHSDPTGTPDFLHCGRAGAQAEGNTLDVGFFAPSRKRR
jgi:hypothetical protein